MLCMQAVLAEAALTKKEPYAHPLCSLEEEWLDDEDEQPVTRLVKPQKPCHCSVASAE